MKVQIWKIARTVLGGAALLISASVQALGEADGVWLKHTFITKNTHQINPVSGEVKKGGVAKGVCYTKLGYVPDGANPGVAPGVYTLTIYCQNDNTGAWQIIGQPFIRELPGGNAAYDDERPLTFYSFKTSTQVVQHVEGFGSHILFIKKDRTGNFKSASFRTVGSELSNSSLNTADTSTFIIGTYLSNGISIPASRLPFSP